MKRIANIFLILLFSFLCGASLALEESWVYPTCGRENTGNFCPEDGAKKPEPWICENCHYINTSQYCEHCGFGRNDEPIDVEGCTVDGDIKYRRFFLANCERREVLPNAGNKV